MNANRDDALAVLRRLRGAGHVAYFAGGCVRDLLLDIPPKDYDIATDAQPKKVRQLFPNSQAVGAAFGVILVRHGGSQIEVATFRTDAAYSDGRHPDAVTFSDAQHDARRRDFTINGLFYDPLEDKVIDFVNGQPDLQARLIRAIGDPNHRFAEDHLRMLRAVRFAARFNFTLDPATADAIRAHAPELKRISPERIADELRRILTPPTRPIAWAFLQDLRLIPELFRLLPQTPVSERSQRPDRTSYPALTSLPPTDQSFGLTLAAAYLELTLTTADIRPLLTHAALTQSTRALRQLFKLSNDESDDFADTLANLAPLLADTPPTLAQKKRFLARPSGHNSLTLLRTLQHLHLHEQRANQLLPELESLLTTDYAPPPLITGDDLTAAGLPPGPLFKRILDQTYDAQLESRVATKDQALAHAISLTRPSPP